MIIKRWKPYDPTCLINTCEYKFEGFSWLEAALLSYTKAKESNRLYTYFEKSSRPNKRGLNWHIQDAIWIEGTTEGDLLMDMIKHNRVSGIGFYDRLFVQVIHSSHDFIQRLKKLIFILTCCFYTQVVISVS